MRHFMNIVLSRLPVFKRLNGVKTELGFGLFALSWLVDGLTGATGFFPQVAAITDAAIAVEGFHATVTSALESLGITLAGLGLYHDKVKREDRY
jgi:hypothetical protein